MATIKRFEELEVWQKSRILNLDLLPIIKLLREEREFEISNQLDRSAGSVMDNIAEGFERDGNKEFIQFLYISKGSLGEVRSRLYRINDRKCIDVEKLSKLQAPCEELGSKLAAFITYLRNSELRGNKFKAGS